jgi:uncharacterized protein (DUF362 family)/ferredoxin
MSDVVVLKTSDDDVEQTVRTLFEMAGGIGKYVSAGERVLVKPNFIAPKKSATGVTTDLRVIEAVVKMVLEQNAEPVVGEGVPIAFDADVTFKRLGMIRLAEELGVELINMDQYPSEVVTIEGAMVLKEIPISKLVFEVDKIINVPVMKTHSQTTVTLGMKNLKGCMPGAHKLTPHRLGVSKAVVDLNTVIKPTFTVMDAIACMEGNGPTNGQLKRMDLLLGSADVLALEIVAAKVMGLDPYTVRHIQLARGKGIGEYEFDNIRVLGASIDEVKSEFLMPATKKNRWLVALVVRLIPMLERCGIDMTNITQRLYERMLPYPAFIDKCTGCGLCLVNCPEQAISFENDKNPVIDKNKCIKCHVCDEVCMFGNVDISGKR